MDCEKCGASKAQYAHEYDEQGKYIHSTLVCDSCMEVLE